MKIEFTINGYVENKNIYFGYQANIISCKDKYYLKDFTFTRPKDGEKRLFTQKCELEYYHKKYGRQKFENVFKILYNEDCNGFDLTFIIDAIKNFSLTNYNRKHNPIHEFEKYEKERICAKCRKEECEYCFGFTIDTLYGYHWINKIKVKEIKNLWEDICNSKAVQEEMDNIIEERIMSAKQPLREYIEKPLTELIEEPLIEFTEEQIKESAEKLSKIFPENLKKHIEENISNCTNLYDLRIFQNRTMKQWINAYYEYWDKLYKIYQPLY